MRKATSALLVFLMLGLAVTVASAADAPKKVIKYTNGSAPPVFEPIMSNYLATGYLTNNLFDGLGRIGKDGVAELGYAESYEADPDGVTYRFKIRRDAKFSDGSPITAHNWVDGFLHQISPETASPGVSLSLFVKGAEAYNQNKGKPEDVGIKALDDYTLQITFENPTPYFRDIICYYFPYKMDVIKKNPEWFKNPKTYISNGAFRVQKFDPQVGFVLERNPYYYDAANVKIDEVHYNFIDDASIALEAYKKGDLNINDSLNAEAVKTYDGVPDLKVIPRIGISYITVHTGNVPDARVRKAMSLALNRGNIAKSVGMPYPSAEGAVPYGIHWGQKHFRDVVGPHPLVKTDIEQAKKLLAEAGYPGGKGLKKMRIITMNGQEEMDWAQAWQSMWKQIGIDSEITSYEQSVYWDVFDTNDWDLARDGWTGDYDDPYTSLFLWMAYREGPDKDARWYDTPNAKEFDRLMKAAEKETDSEKRFNLFKQAESTLLDDMPIIPHLQGIDTILIKPDVTGIVKASLGHIYFQYADVKTD